MFVFVCAVVGCYNLTDKEWFSKQDPYVVIDYSGQKFRTRTDTGGIDSYGFSFKLIKFFTSLN